MSGCGHTGFMQWSNCLCVNGGFKKSTLDPIFNILEKNFVTFVSCFEEPRTYTLELNKLYTSGRWTNCHYEWGKELKAKVNMWNMCEYCRAAWGIKVGEMRERMRARTKRSEAGGERDLPSGLYCSLYHWPLSARTHAHTYNCRLTSRPAHVREGSCFIHAPLTYHETFNNTNCVGKFSIQVEWALFWANSTHWLNSWLQISNSAWPQFTQVFWPENIYFWITELQRWRQQSCFHQSIFVHILKYQIRKGKMANFKKICRCLWDGFCHTFSKDVLM